MVGNPYPRLLDPDLCVKCYLGTRAAMAPGRSGLEGLLAETRGRTELFVESYNRLFRGRDPLASLKDRLNRDALKLLDNVAELLKDPVQGLGVVALANSVDVWMPWHKGGGIGEQSIEGEAVYLEARETLARLLSSASSAVVLLDNAGEAVIDIAYTLLALTPHIPRTYLVARGEPYETDVTAEEAKALLRVVADRLGIPPAGVEVVSTGSSYPGPAEGFAAHEAVELIRTAGLVISKGVANLEALAEYRCVERHRVIVAFRAKCPALAMIYGVPLGTAVVARGYPSMDHGR